MRTRQHLCELRVISQATELQKSFGKVLDGEDWVNICGGQTCVTYDMI